MAYCVLDLLVSLPVRSKFFPRPTSGESESVLIHNERAIQRRSERTMLSEEEADSSAAKRRRVDQTSSVLSEEAPRRAATAAAPPTPVLPAAKDPSPATAVAPAASPPPENRPLLPASTTVKIRATNLNGHEVCSFHCNLSEEELNRRTPRDLLLSHLRGRTSQCVRDALTVAKARAGLHETHFYGSGSSNFPVRAYYDPRVARQDSALGDFDVFCSGVASSNYNPHKTLSAQVVGRIVVGRVVGGDVGRGVGPRQGSGSGEGSGGGTRAFFYGTVAGTIGGRTCFWCGTLEQGQGGESPRDQCPGEIGQREELGTQLSIRF